MAALIGLVVVAALIIGTIALGRWGWAHFTSKPTGEEVHASRVKTLQSCIESLQAPINDPRYVVPTTEAERLAMVDLLKNALNETERACSKAHDLSGKGGQSIRKDLDEVAQTAHELRLCYTSTEPHPTFDCTDASNRELAAMKALAGHVDDPAQLESFLST